MPRLTPVIWPVVLDEIAGGDAEAAARRMEAVAGWDVLALTDEAVTLAAAYFDAIALPEAARADSLHMALATEHGVEYLVTWNCRHIASARVRQVVQTMNDRRGLQTPMICTPEELLEY